jgi:hypothetical protein
MVFSNICVERRSAVGADDDPLSAPAEGPGLPNELEAEKALAAGIGGHDWQADEPVPPYFSGAAAGEPVQVMFRGTAKRRRVKNPARPAAISVRSTPS